MSLALYCINFYFLSILILIDIVLKFANVIILSIRTHWPEQPECTNTRCRQ